MKFLIDDREPAKIGRIMSKLIECEVMRLDVGDVVCEEKSFAIERKSIVDFVGCVKSGKIFKDVMQLSQNFQHVYLIIEGHYKDLRFGGFVQWTVDQHLGSIASLCARSRVQIITVDNATQFCKLAVKLATKTDDGKVFSIKDTELLKNTITTNDMRLKLLSCFPGIGLKKAKMLLENNEVKAAVSELITISKIITKMK